MESTNAFLVLGVSILTFFLGYRFYGSFWERMFKVQKGLKGPAYSKEDGKEFVPTRRWVVFGHHFASIAGLGPIMGPAVAVFWGWLPALLWVVLGSIVIGAVHDYSATMISLRHSGRGISDVACDYLGKRARFIFLSVVFFLLALGMGLFVITIATLFVYHHPEAVLPVFLLMGLATTMGVFIYKLRMKLLPLTLVGVLLVFLFGILGQAYPIHIYQYFLPDGIQGEIWQDVQQRKQNGDFQNQLLLVPFQGGSFGNAFEHDGIFGRFTPEKGLPQDLKSVENDGFPALLPQQPREGKQQQERRVEKELDLEYVQLQTKLSKILERSIDESGLMPIQAAEKLRTENKEAKEIHRRLAEIKQERIALKNQSLQLPNNLLSNKNEQLIKRPLPSAFLVQRFVESKASENKAQKLDLLKALEAEQVRLDGEGEGRRSAQALELSIAKPGVLAQYYNAIGKTGWADQIQTTGNKARVFWVVILLSYAFVASLLPVWLLLQPRDYLNSWKLYIGIAGILIGLIVWQLQAWIHGSPSPGMVAPAFTGFYGEELGISGMPALLPFLFIIVACGACSGFHSLVGSGTSSRQLQFEGDAKPVAYGGMLLEALFAVIVIIACTIGISQTGWLSALKISGGFAEQKTAAAAISRFIHGGGDMMASFFGLLGLSREVCVAFLATVCVTFAMTTLDSATRLLRYNIEEFGIHFGKAGEPSKRKQNKLLGNLGLILRIPFVSTGLGVLAIAFFALFKVNGKLAGLHLLALFGSTNQLLAAFGLLVVSFWLRRSKKPVFLTIVPFLIMLVMSVWAMVESLLLELQKAGREGFGEHWILISVSGVLLALALWMVIEAALHWRPRLSEKTPDASLDTIK